MSDELKQSGVKRRSGRYAWGSGKDPQRSLDILAKKDELAAKGLSSVEQAKALGMNTTELRNAIAWANEDRKRIILETVHARSERGDSTQKIADDTGISESSVRGYLKKPLNPVQTTQLENISKMLKEEVDKHTYLDVGVGVERQIGISETKLKAAVSKLEEEGYYMHKVYTKRIQNMSNSLTIKVLTKEPDVKVVAANSAKIRPIEKWSDDGGLTSRGLKPIKFIDWDKVYIKYGDKGGVDKDGVIELRRGVEDLDLGTKNYAQVRIGVGGTHYLKGMALYADDMPAGKDIIFNTNKPSGTPKEKVLKQLSDNKDNPFGATIKPKGQRGSLNIVNEEGDWNKWGSYLSAQFLSKQPLNLVKERLNATYDDLTAEHELLSSLTNPVVKKHLMEAYASGLDSKAKHLKVKAIAKTKSHVLLPFPDMNPNEVYAPGYDNGAKVVLVRYPHGGTFELPELTVNNKGPAKKLGNIEDGIGIHPSVASKLSGADFDGDTVYVIPNDNRKVKTSRTLAELKDFDPVGEYQVDHVTISPKYKQKQMGIVSNLITDMTIKNASQSEIARAVRHSMVVIDSEKHKLDWKKSARDNGIQALQKSYQTHVDPVTGKTKGGASTIISQSKQVVKNIGGQQLKEVDTRMNRVRKGKVKPVEEYEYVNRKTGKVTKRIRGGVDVDLIDLVSDVSKLSSGTAVEEAYVDYIKRVKSLNNTVLKEMETIPKVRAIPAATKKYAPEVKALDAKLNEALLNAPRERQAQLKATQTYYKNLKPDMTDDEKKKIKSQAVAAAREIVGAKRAPITITDKEWEAIQQGAISTTKLDKILKNTDMDKVLKLATPRDTVKMPTAKLTRAKVMLEKYTYAEVAKALGVTVSSLKAEMMDDKIDDSYEKEAR